MENEIAEKVWSLDPGETLYIASEDGTYVASRVQVADNQFIICSYLGGGSIFYCMDVSHLEFDEFRPGFAQFMDEAGIVL